MKLGRPQASSVFPRRPPRYCLCRRAQPNLCRRAQPKLRLSRGGCHWKALRRYGEVDSAQVVMRSARKNRGFGYVRFREPEGAAAALASPADPPIVLGKALDVRCVQLLAPWWSGEQTAAE